MKNQRGITLIALVITIVILIILAGVAINMTLGENGILEKAKYAKEQYEIAGVREEIELAILEIQADKASKNEDFSIEAILSELPSKVGGITLEKEGNSLKGSFNGYNFTINESMKLSIEGESVEVTVGTEVKQYLGKDANGKYAVKVLLTLNSEDTIDTVKIENTDGSTTEETIGNNTYSKEIELELDKEYRINIESENGAKTAKKISVSSITNISNVDQFVAFRDSINSGLTYEGATINLTTDLDLSRVCYKVDGTTTNDVSWEPIGNSTNPFKGIFNGNHKTIKNLYINTTSSNQGLFGYIEIATIKGIITDSNSKIIGKSNIGGIVAKAIESNILECGNNATVTGSSSVIGGIVGYISKTKIISTYNKGTISSSSSSVVGGIVGTVKIAESVDDKSVISYSYNTGNITGCKYVAGISGEGTDYMQIYNCYNIGNITNIENNYAGGIVGRMRAYGVISYCHNKGIVNNEGAGYGIGGIIGENTSYDGSIYTEERKSIAIHCYNSGNIISKGNATGGIIGLNNLYCEAKECYVCNETKIQYNGIDATNNVGDSSNNELGKIIGTNKGTEENNGILDEMPTVYYVVNGLSDGESEYWSNSNPDQPKLLWEK